ncbi:MAG: symporter small accessory protein [Methanomassiliicoccales archaeon]
MFGIEDPWVWSGYVLSIVLTIICVVYGILKWNKDED